jgi:hypothetical protein
MLVGFSFGLHVGGARDLASRYPQNMKPLQNTWMQLHTKEQTYYDEYLKNI